MAKRVETINPSNGPTWCVQPDYKLSPFWADRVPWALIVQLGRSSLSAQEVMIVVSRKLLLGGLDELVSLGVTAACARGPVTVVGSAAGREQLIRMSIQLEPDVVLADASLVDEVIVAQLPSSRVLIFGEHGPVDHVMLLRAGLAGFVSRATLAERLLQDIERAASGSVVLSYALQASFAERLISREDGTGASPRVTPRQREILGLIAAGQKDSEIAEALHLSRTTIKTQLRRVNETLGTKTRAEAACRALQLGLLDIRVGPGKDVTSGPG